MTTPTPKVLTEADLAGLPRAVSSEGARAHADFLDFGGHEKPANLIRALVSERDALAGRVAELEAALQAAGDLAASSRSGPAKAESLLGIEEIATQALEHRGVRLAAPQAVQDIANEICQAVAELPDRNSPEDWPEAMLVTHDELQFIVTEAIAALTTTSGDSHG